jgi:hypothetical protein
MAAPLNTCTTIEQRGVVRFLWAKNMEAKDIHIQEMLPIWAAYFFKFFASVQGVHCDHSTRSLENPAVQGLQLNTDYYT